MPMENLPFWAWNAPACWSMYKWADSHVATFTMLMQLNTDCVSICHRYQLPYTAAEACRSLQIAMPCPWLLQTYVIEELSLSMQPVGNDDGPACSWCVIYRPKIWALLNLSCCRAYTVLLKLKLCIALGHVNLVIHMFTIWFDSSHWRQQRHNTDLWSAVEI